MPWSSGTFTRSHDWTSDEASSINIEAVRMDQEDDNFAAGINNTLAKDGQNTPTADLPMAGNRHTGVGNANARNTYASAADVQDQDLIYFVDSGAANAYVITPSPAITAYEEGQRFVFRATNANTGASTLNVNALGAIAIQTSDGNALASGAIIAGGYYEVTYDANPATDRFVMTSMPSAIADGMLSSNVPRKDAANTFTQTFSSPNFALNVSATAPGLRLSESDQGLDGKDWALHGSGGTLLITSRTDAGATGETLLSASRTGTNIDTLALSADGITLNGVDVTDYARLSVLPVFTNGGIEVESGQPFVTWDETDGGTNQRLWRALTAGGAWQLVTRTDADGTGQTALSVTRSGTSVDVVNFPNGTLQYGGSEVLRDSNTTVVRTTGAQTVGGVKTLSSRPLSSGAGGFLSHASSGNTGGSITISNTLAGSAGAVGGPGDMRAVYS